MKIRKVYYSTRSKVIVTLKLELNVRNCHSDFMLESQCKKDQDPNTLTLACSAITTVTFVTGTFIRTTSVSTGRFICAGMLAQTFVYV